MLFCHQRKNNPSWGGCVLVLLPPEEEESALGRFRTCSSATIGRTISIGVAPYLFFCRQRKHHPCWGCSVLVLLPPEEGLSALGRLRTCSSATRGRTICIGASPFFFLCHQRKNNPQWGGSVLVLLPPEEELSALGRLRTCSSATRGRTIRVGAAPILFSCQQGKNNPHWGHQCSGFSKI